MLLGHSHAGPLSDTSRTDAHCEQHDPFHEHTWAAGKPFRPGGMIPVRCVVCGGRKCDMPRCIRIRHHREDHSDWLGYNGAVVNG